MVLLRLILLLGLTTSLTAQSDPDAAFIRANYTKREVLIPMRDGVRLFTSIYTPKDQSQTYPILMRRTPYSCSPYGAGAFPGSFQNMNLAQSGYIFVFQDVRGRYMSEGAFVDVRPFNPDKKTYQDVDEASDTYDTVEWLLRNVANNNGRVGVLGISYPGFYATMAALAGHPAIKAVSPQAPVTDWFIGDDFHHNGAFMLMDAFSFYSGFGKKRPQPTTKGQPGFNAWNTPDNYLFYLRAGALSNFGKHYGMDSIPFWNDLMAHPDYDAFWQARNPRPHLKNIKPAVMTVGGLFDAEDCWGAWNVYKSIENQNPRSHPNHVVMGPWSHGGWSRGTGEKLGNVKFGAQTSEHYQRSVEFRFFEHYLKDRGEHGLPDALVFETGSNRWTSHDQWPPKTVQPKPYYLTAGGTVTAAKPPAVAGTANQAFDEYVSDPARPVPYTEDVHLRRTREYMTDDQRFAARRPDVVVYQTEVLTDSLRLAGPITADLWVSTTGTDADFVVKLIDVYPDTLKGEENGTPMGGYQMLVRGEVMRGRYRNGFDKPEAFKPGEVTRVTFELPDVAHCFKPGHRLMIQIQSSWFPLVDRNPQQFVNIYECSDADFIKANHRIWHTSEHASNVVLPVMK
jgi:hypothetical protein